MEVVPRNTVALLAKIDQIRNSLIKRFENIVALAAIDETSRNATALTTYQMRVETAGLIRTSEDILSLSRQLQDLWLFGQLRTLEASGSRDEIDAMTKEVGDLLRQVMTLQQQPGLDQSQNIGPIEVIEAEDAQRGGELDEAGDQGLETAQDTNRDVDMDLGREVDGAS